MAEKSANNSWNPLSYSQNLCIPQCSGFAVNSLIMQCFVLTIVSLLCPTGVVSNASTTESIDHSLEHNRLLDSLSALDIQRDANHGINRLVNDLIANNGNDLRFKGSQSVQTLDNQSSRAFIGDNVCNKSSNIVFNDSNGLNCGDFALNTRHKSDATTLSANTDNQFTPVSRNESIVFNINSIPFIPTADLMSSKSYSQMKSFPQQIRSLNTNSQQVSHQNSNRFSQPFNNGLSDQLKNVSTHPFSNPMPKLMSNPITNAMTNQLNTSMSSEMIESKERQSIMQSLFGSKSQPLPYNQNYQQIGQQMEKSTQESSLPTGRPLRSIRARNPTPNTIDSTNKLNYYLEKSCEHFKHLEKERKKIEFELIQAFIGHKISSANNIPIQRLPQNASKIDKIITDMSREHAKVITIIAKMEQLKGRELSESIHNSVQKWVEIIRDLQMKRKYEMQRNSTTIGTICLAPEDSFSEQICDVLQELWKSIRSVRTGLWSASVLTLYDKHFA